MTLEGLPPPVLITRPAGLARLVERLSIEPIVAVDTESNSLHAYREQVCLIQFSTPETDYLVDPLALNDLSPLAPLFADPYIEKIFHAAEYDLICLKRDFGFTFNNLFDTMVAARILGREAVGLGAILEEEFDLHLDKRFQRADWGQRPLPANLLSYARMDTHYLIPLRNRLRQDLQEEGKWELAKEDFERMRLVNINGRLDHTAGCWRVTGSYDLDPQQAAILLELCNYRDKIARSLNRPLFKVINDRTLLAIAQEIPASLNDLSKLPGMSRGQIERHGRSLLAATQRGLQAKPVYPPRPPRPDEEYLERLEALRRWRKHKGQQMGVKSDIVLPRDLMNSLAEENPQTEEALEALLQDVPWRKEHFGQEILALLARVSQKV